MTGPLGGGAPVDSATLYNVALGLADVTALVERPREVRAPYSSRAMTARELATAMQTLAMIGNVFARALPPSVVAELRESMFQIYVDAGLVEPPRGDCPFEAIA